MLSRCVVGILFLVMASAARDYPSGPLRGPRGPVKRDYPSGPIRGPPGPIKRDYPPGQPDPPGPPDQQGMKRDYPPGQPDPPGPPDQQGDHGPPSPGFMKKKLDVPPNVPLDNQLIAWWYNQGHYIPPGHGRRDAMGLPGLPGARDPPIPGFTEKNWSHDGMIVAKCCK